MSWWRWLGDDEVAEEESLPEHDVETVSDPGWWDRTSRGLNVEAA